jgi:hypothetical protein
LIHKIRDKAATVKFISLPVNRSNCGQPAVNRLTARFGSPSQKKRVHEKGRNEPHSSLSNSTEPTNLKRDA